MPVLFSGSDELSGRLPVLLSGVLSVLLSGALFVLFSGELSVLLSVELPVLLSGVLPVLFSDVLSVLLSEELPVLLSEAEPVLSFVLPVLVGKVEEDDEVDEVDDVDAEASDDPPALSGTLSGTLEHPQISTAARTADKTALPIDLIFIINNLSLSIFVTLYIL